MTNPVTSSVTSSIVDTDHAAGVRELRLARPPANALDPALIAALRAAVNRATADGRSAIVLSGAPGLFSGGLDVPALLQLDREALRRAWKDFFGLLEDLARSPIPVVAALTGHSPAGGTVLAIYADHRVMAEGSFRVGLNEVQVGLPVPAAIYRALVYLTGEREAARLAVNGLLVESAEALRCGLVDDLAPVTEVVPRALAWATALVSRPPTAMRGTRALARQPLVEAFASVDDALIDGVIEQWLSAETQTVLRALAARLNKPKS